MNLRELYFDMSDEVEMFYLTEGKETSIDDLITAIEEYKERLGKLIGVE